MLEYFAALKETIDFVPSDALEVTILRYMKYRRHSICVDAIFAFVESVLSNNDRYLLTL